APFEIWLKSSDVFLSFARDYIRARKAPIEESFQVTPALLDEFQLYLSERGTNVSLAEWTSAVDLIREGLQQEIFNLTLGVEKGDEVELRNDPQVLAALRALQEESSQSQSR